MISYSDFFSLLSDETRLRCLSLIMVKSEICVCEITHALDMSQPKVSRHLSILRSSKLVLSERRGQWMYYKINKDFDEDKLDLLLEIVDQLKLDTLFSSDLKKLKECNT